MIKCIAIDDEPLALKQMSSYIKKTPNLELASAFTSAIKALDYVQNNSIDLMLVDINMPDLNGLDFVKSLTNPPKVIFTTAYREYAVEGFKVDAADYLVKPIAYADFLLSVNKVVNRYFTPVQNTTPAQSTISDESIFIKSEYKTLRINLKDILFIESKSDYIRLHLEQDKPIMALMSMKKMSEHLPDNFMRVHRSYIVNLNKIAQIERGRIVFGNTYIAVSEQHKDEFNSFLEKKSIT